MNPLGRKWSRIALINLGLVALAGIFLRLKILLPLTWLNHKYLLHAHSHFAFAGWVSLFLMAALVGTLPGKINKVYDKILFVYAISAYGMFLSFPFQGYGAVSIIFSTLSVLVSWWFAWQLWKDLHGDSLNSQIAANIRWALAFLVLSAAGTFFLAWLMANKIDDARLYFGAVYFYLHFQYNGWFFFAIVSLFLSQVTPSLRQQLNKPLQWMAFACIPAFFLSALWMRLPDWMYITAVVAAVMQLLAFSWLLVLVIRKAGAQLHDPAVKQIWILSLLALAIKILLQSLSIFPSLSKYAFAYRPVVIGYLHLVLLGFVSLFLIGWLIRQGILVTFRSRVPVSIWIFIVGILITEATLMAQGFTAMFFIAIPHTNEMLLFAAILLLAGIVWMNLQVKNNNGS